MARLGKEERTWRKEILSYRKETLFSETTKIPMALKPGMRSLETFPELMFGIMCFHVKP